MQRIPGLLMDHANAAAGAQVDRYLRSGAPARAEDVPANRRTIGGFQVTVQHRLGLWMARDHGANRFRPYRPHGVALLGAPPSILHAKCVIFDDNQAFLTSANFRAQTEASRATKIPFFGVGPFPLQGLKMAQPNDPHAPGSPPRKFARSPQVKFRCAPS